MDPTVLHPAEQLQWSISSESAKDIDIAKKNLDRCVHVLALFQDSQHQESLGMRLCVSSRGWKIELLISMVPIKYSLCLVASAD